MLPKIRVMIKKNRAWEIANPEKVKEMARRSYLKHKAKRNAESKAWAEKNRDYVLQYHKDYNQKWYQENKERRSKQLREYGKAHKQDNVRRVQKYFQTPKGSHNTYKANAKRKERDFSLSAEEFVEIIKTPCVYCGEEKERRGIDRIDNKQGYTKENSAPACKICNYMKKTMTVQDFLYHVKKITRYNGD